MALDFFAGSVGGISGVLVGHPFDTVKHHESLMHNDTVDLRQNFKKTLEEVRLQTQPSSSYSGMIQCFAKIFREESVFGLYKGLLPPLAGFAAMNAITFGVQGITYRRLEPGLKSFFISGAVAGVAQSIVVSPMELIKTQLQLQGQGMKYKHALRHTPDEKLRFNGSWDCMKKIYKSQGLKGCYRGFIATAAREGPAMGLYFAMYHGLCSLMARSRESVDQLGILHLLIAGGVTGSASWVFTYPVDVVKSRYQADIDGKYKGLVDCFKQTYRSGGMPVFWRGLSTAVVRAFPVNAATLATVTLILRNDIA